MIISIKNITLQKNISTTYLHHHAFIFHYNPLHFILKYVEPIIQFVNHWAELYLHPMFLIYGFYNHFLFVYIKLNQN